jgi:ATP-binding cassette subfamily F protein uup
MIYFTASNLTLSYAHKTILDDVSFSIVKGQKIALVADNGSGKSTLLKVLMGLVDVTRGDIERNQSIKTSYLAQHHTIDPAMKVMDVLFSLEHPHSTLIKHYETLLLDPDHDSYEMETILAKIEAVDARWYETQVKTIISKLQLQPFLEQPFGQLSGGEAKRVSLAKVLLDEADLLILDEPTNHLDLDMIERLEGFLKKSTVTLLLVTHDRYFLERVCTEIMELDKGSCITILAVMSIFCIKKLIVLRSYTEISTRWSNSTNLSANEWTKCPKAEVPNLATERKNSLHSSRPIISSDNINFNHHKHSI